MIGYAKMCGLRDLYCRPDCIACRAAFQDVGTGFQPVRRVWKPALFRLAAAQRTSHGLLQATIGGICEDRPIAPKSLTRPRKHVARQTNVGTGFQPVRRAWKPALFRVAAAPRTSHDLLQAAIGGICEDRPIAPKCLTHPREHVARQSNGGTGFQSVRRAWKPGKP
jgi:hypothetical protein